MKLEDLKTRVNQLIAAADAVVATQKEKISTSERTGKVLSRTVTVDNELFQEFRAASTSFIGRVLGTDSGGYIDYTARVRTNYLSDTTSGRGLLKALKQEIDGGWLVTVKGLVSAEIFTDFLEMAGHLLEENYKDPAAVMIGSVLEEHLRQLCKNNGIDITIPDTRTGKDVPKKADRMNTDLYTAGVYNKLYQKTILSWLDLRNQAAHGHYTEYDIKQVRLMESGVVDFIAKTS